MVLPGLASEVLDATLPVRRWTPQKRGFAGHLAGTLEGNSRSCRKQRMPALHCYWVTDLTSTLGNGVFHQTPKKLKLFAGGSRATKFHIAKGQSRFGGVRKMGNSQRRIFKVRFVRLLFAVSVCCS